MKNKLKYLFAYFRGFKSKEITTTFAMDYGRIEDWEERFTAQNLQKDIFPINQVVSIVEEIVNDKMDDFYKYNNYEEDSWWYLYMTILPFENKIVFNSSCKYRQEEDYSIDLKIYDLDTYEQILKIREENDCDKIQFDCQGSWGDGDISNVELDGRDKMLTTNDDTPYWDIAFECFSEYLGKYWHEERGGKGELTIWGDDIFGDVTRFETEYEETEMNYVITLDDYT
jgi:hypothetical protein